MIPLSNNVPPPPIDAPVFGHQQGSSEKTGRTSLVHADVYPVSEQIHKIALSGAFPVPIDWFESCHCHPVLADEISLEDFLNPQLLRQLYEEMLDKADKEHVELLLITCSADPFFQLKANLQEGLLPFTESMQGAIADLVRAVLEEILKDRKFNCDVVILLSDWKTLSCYFNEEHSKKGNHFKAIPQLKFCGPSNQEVLLFHNKGMEEKRLDEMLHSFQKEYPIKAWVKRSFTDRENLFEYKKT